MLYSPYFEKNIRPFPSKKTSTVMISQKDKSSQGMAIYKNEKQVNNCKVIRNNNINMREDQSLNMFNKMTNDNANINNNKYNNKNKNDNLNSFLQKLYIPRQNSNTVVFYNSNTKPKNKKTRFNIYDIINEAEPNGENEKKKIIVGLKDVKVISNNKNNKKENKNKTNNLIYKEKQKINKYIS
jgi:hypothetical protein